MTQAPTEQDPEALFVSDDPKLHQNKQVVLRFMREVVQCGHWEKAPELMTERYIQHNPLAVSGIEGVMNFFKNYIKTPRQEVCGKLETKVTSVIAEGDFVLVTMPIRYPHPDKPGEHYDTLWFDMWRIVDGKMDEHWDSQRLFPGLTPEENARLGWDL